MATNSIQKARAKRYVTKIKVTPLCVGAETKWSPFYTRHFKWLFHRALLYFDSSFAAFSFSREGSN